MSKPSCMVIVVLEDDHHEMLLRRYLKKRGIRKHEMRIRRSPSGQGSAESWVRREFVKEVRVYRTRHAQTKLIVAIDADNHTVQRRLAQLDQALGESGLPAIGNGEQVARLVPKRNVETWILCLNGQPVNEETDFKTRTNNWDELIPHAAEVLFQWTRLQGGQPNNCIDSLRAGVRELNRLRF